ncbi:hypothetical protein RJ641_035443, partial [Dillenia turbinata]
MPLLYVTVSAFGFGWTILSKNTIPALVKTVSNHVVLHLGHDFSVHDTGIQGVPTSRLQLQVPKTGKQYYSQIAKLEKETILLGSFFLWLSNTENWKRLKSRLMKADYCNNLPKKYKTSINLQISHQLKLGAADHHMSSSNSYCKHYKNCHGVKCYNCASCKAGVAKYMKMEWRVVAIFNVVLFVILSMIHFFGMLCMMNAARNSFK